jgi:hypothetical protein
VFFAQNDGPFNSQGSLGSSFVTIQGLYMARRLSCSALGLDFVEEKKKRKRFLIRYRSAPAHTAPHRTAPHRAVEE